MNSHQRRKKRRAEDRAIRARGYTPVHWDREYDGETIDLTQLDHFVDKNGITWRCKGTSHNPFTLQPTGMQFKE